MARKPKRKVVKLQDIFEAFKDIDLGLDPEGATEMVWPKVRSWGVEWVVTFVDTMSYRRRKVKAGELLRYQITHGIGAADPETVDIKAAMSNV